MSQALHGLDVIIGAVTSSKREAAKSRLSASGARAVMTGNKLLAASRGAKRGKSRSAALRAGNKLVHSGSKARNQATVLGAFYATFSPTRTLTNVLPPAPAPTPTPVTTATPVTQATPTTSTSSLSYSTQTSSAPVSPLLRTSTPTTSTPTAPTTYVAPTTDPNKQALMDKYGAARSTVTPVITMTEDMANQRVAALDIAVQAGELGNLIVALIERLDAAGLTTVGDIGMALLDRIDNLIERYDPDAPSPDLSAELSSIRADYQKWSTDAETQLRIAAAPIATPAAPTDASTAAPAGGSAPPAEDYFMEQPSTAPTDDMVDWGDESHYEKDLRQFEEMVPRSPDEDSGPVDWEQESDVMPLYTEDFEQDDTDVYEHDATEEAEGDGLVERAATDLEGIYGDAVLPTWQKAGMIAGVFGLALGGTMLFSNAMARR